IVAIALAGFFSLLLAGTLVELRDALFRVEDLFGIQLVGVGKPLDGIGRAPGLCVRIGVSVGHAQLGDVWSVGSVEFFLEGDDGLFVTVKVLVGTGNVHGDLYACLRVQLLGAVFAGHSQRLLRSTELSLSVGKDGNQTWATLHATSSAQLRDGFLPLSSVVR